MNNFWGTLYQALSYSGNCIFVLINYFLLSCTLFVYLFTKLKRVNTQWWIPTLLATILQVLFWFLLKVQGISIIWNAISGMLLLDYLRSRKGLDTKEKITIYLVLLFVLAGDLYFAIIAPLITTIAHICAILLGILLRLLFRGSKQPEEN